MQLSVAQLKQDQLALFVQQTMSGAALSGNLSPYFQANGWVGNNVVYTTGNQVITGDKVFSQSPHVPYSGDVNSVVSAQYVIDSVAASSNAINSYILNFTVGRGQSNDVISGAKSFTGAIQIGLPTNQFHAVRLDYLSGVSGVLQSQISSIVVPNVVSLTGDQVISGRKSYDQSPFVPTPTDGSGAVPRSYLDNLRLTGVVYTSGDQTVSGIITFLQSPVIPVGISTNAPVTLAQLNATAFNYSPTSGYSVTSLNGVTGGILTQGVNGISTYMCGNVLYVSGNNVSTTQLYSVQIPLPAAATGLSFIFGTGFSSKPTVTISLEVTGGSPISFFDTKTYGVTTAGFNLAFQTGIPNSNYVCHAEIIPTISGSGFFGIQGAQGQVQPTWNPRGVWQAGLSYSVYDMVYQPSIGTSYVAYSGNNSSSFNSPQGTGNSWWTIVSSGQYGIKGDVGQVGYLLNSGTITGSFTVISYYMNPVSTGLNAAEAFVGNNFQLSGIALGCWQSGAGPTFGGVLSGAIYVRSLTNVKTQLFQFTFNSGINSYISGGFGYPITGYYRIGVDMTNTLSGIQGFSVGLFGF